MYALNCIKIGTAIDPACGSGNFLTQTYIELRKLENEALKEIIATEQISGQMMLGGDVTPIKVGIHQLYGIEINDFAVSVARTALWIAEHKMLRETENIMQVDLIRAARYAADELVSLYKILIVGAVAVFKIRYSC